MLIFIIRFFFFFKCIFFSEKEQDSSFEHDPPTLNPAPLPISHDVDNPEPLTSEKSLATEIIPEKLTNPVVSAQRDGNKSTTNSKESAKKITEKSVDSLHKVSTPVDINVDISNKSFNLHSRTLKLASHSDLEGEKSAYLNKPCETKSLGDSAKTDRPLTSVNISVDKHQDTHSAGANISKQPVLGLRKGSRRTRSRLPSEEWVTSKGPTDISTLGSAETSQVPSNTSAVDSTDIASMKSVDTTPSSAERLSVASKSR